MILSLVLLGLLALGLAAALALFLSVKREIRAQARANRARLDQILRQVNTAPLHDTPPPAPETAELAHLYTPPHTPLRSGMNLSKRLQALRLLRRGEDIGHVAAALGISRREVELLVRVQEFSAKRAAGAG
jgi:DNA-binding NarL/FixJ family response regulator